MNPEQKHSRKQTDVGIDTAQKLTGSLPPPTRAGTALRIEGELQREWIAANDFKFLVPGWAERFEDIAAIDSALLRVREPLTLRSTEPLCIIFTNDRGEEQDLRFSVDRSVSVPTGATILLALGSKTVSFVKVKNTELKTNDFTLVAPPPAS